MRKALAVSVVLALLNVPSLAAAPIRSDYAPARSLLQDQGYQGYVAYSPEQLDNLLAPIALYPDPLLAQVLLAATFVDQIDEAARWVRANGTAGIDSQYWDVSVKAVAHYPTVLYMMADKLDWTTALGQAYVNQSTDVMTSVQRLRREARAQGNLVTSPQMEVVEEGGLIEIWPANPQFIYVPVYDPAIVYVRRPFWGFALAFGAGFVIGSWLNYDCDWRDRRIYYHGWRGAGWVERSRPYVQINNVYVNNRYTNITVNRTVVERNVNYNNINRYNYVHRDVTFDDHARGRDVPRPDNRVNNKIINRNINTADPRLNTYRGREGRPAPAGQPQRPPSEGRTPGPPERGRGAPAPPARPAPPMPGRPAPQAAQASPRPAPHGFGRSEGGFDPRTASQRGQASRAEASRPSPPSRPSRSESAPARSGRPSGKR